MADDKLARVRGCIGFHQDFPKPGIGFRDIFPVLCNPSVFKDLVDLIVEAAKKNCPNAECVAGLESRGFLFGPILAQALNVPFVPLRKKGKLPGELLSLSYQLEYGTDTIEVQKDAIKPNQKVLIIDDLIATGGSMKAACQLVETAGAEVSLCMVLIELLFLNGKSLIGKPFHSIVQFDN